MSYWTNGKRYGIVGDWVDAKAKTITTSASTAQVALPVDGSSNPYAVVTVTATGNPAWVRLGTSGSVTAATSDGGFTVYCPVGWPIDIPTVAEGQVQMTNIAAISSGSGSLIVCARA